MRQRYHVSAYYCFTAKEMLHKVPVNNLRLALYTWVSSGVRYFDNEFGADLNSDNIYCYSGLINNNKLIRVCKKWKF